MTVQAKRAALAVALVALAAACLYCLLGGDLGHAGNAPGSVPESSNSQQLNAQGRELCMNAAGNRTAMEMAIYNGITCFRTDIGISQEEESYIANVSAQGGQFLGILDYQTVGAQPSASSPSGCSSGCNWTLADWNASVAEAVAEYPEVHSWEIWNEPLVGIFMDGYQNGSALHYFEMLRSAYTIIKGKYPNDTVVCFGGAAASGGDEVSYQYRFYSQVWGYGASDYCDAISLHAYTYEGDYSMGQEVGGVSTEQEWNYSLNLYEQLTGKPIWITETGAEAYNLSENESQAPFAQQDLDFFASYPFVSRVYWFQLASYQNEPWGLISLPSVQPKPAWHTVLSFLRNGTYSS